MRFAHCTVSNCIAQLKLSDRKFLICHCKLKYFLRIENDLRLYFFCHCRLKSISVVVKHSQTAESLVKLYEAKLCEEDALNSDMKSIENITSTLKVVYSHCLAN